MTEMAPARTEQSTKRFGVRWALAGGVALSSVDQARTMARLAVETGFDGYWISQSNAVDPIVALAAAGDSLDGLVEVGTSVVPLYGRHPVGLAQMACTAQSALDGRLTLGIGPSHRAAVEETYGLSWDRPLGYTAEFLDGLQPLLAGTEVSMEGGQITARAELNIDAPETPILLAALGPRMLILAGQRTAGTTVGQCGPKTIRSHIAPAINEAATDAGRPNPRVMALIRLCITESPAAAYAQAREVGAFYSALPSYAAVLEREGVADPADLHLIGSWEQVLDGLAAYAEAGATDFRLEVVAPTEAERHRSFEALAAYLT